MRDKRLRGTSSLPGMSREAGEGAGGRLGRGTLPLVVACLALMTLLSLLAACGSGPSQSTQAPPAGTELTAGTATQDGATLLETRCSVCHGTERVTSAKKTRAQWEETVTRMIGRGAELTDAEATVLVDYLAAHYAP